jgi:hypothetical protein
LWPGAVNRPTKKTPYVHVGVDVPCLASREALDGEHLAMSIGESFSRSKNLKKTSFSGGVPGPHTAEANGMSGDRAVLAAAPVAAPIGDPQWCSLANLGRSLGLSLFGLKSEQ